MAVIVLRSAPSNLPESLREVVDYRKSGLSLNHVVGCPLDCGYCVRHLFSNFDMKQPHLLMKDEQAVEALINHWAFRPHTTPIQLFNRATDPLLPGVKEHMFSTLEELDRRGLKNHVLVITRWHVLKEDVERFDALRHVRLTVLVTWSSIEDKRIEPVDSGIAEQSLITLNRHASRTKAILYWRPLIAGVNDAPRHLSRARELSLLADATVFTGLSHREEIRAYLREAGVPDIYDVVARRKILPMDVERRVLNALRGRSIFRKTSCGVAFAHRDADYNGHYGIRDICDICPSSQVAICARAHLTPDLTTVRRLAAEAGLDPALAELHDGHVQVSASNEQQRYFMQHTMNYQVHDRAHPHLPRRHGRAEVGWN